LPGVDVTEVVLVEKPLVDAEFENAQSDLLGIGREARAAIVVNALILTVDVKQIQMPVTPAEGDLQRIMLVRDDAIVADQQSGARSSD